MTQDKDELIFEPFTPLVINLSRRIDSFWDVGTHTLGRLVNVFPVGRYILRSLILLTFYLFLSLPALLSSVLIGNLIFASGDIVLSLEQSLNYLWGLITWIPAEPSVFIPVFVGLYAVGLVRFEFYNMFAYSKLKAPELPVRWERMVESMGTVSFLGTYYLLVTFRPDTIGSTFILGASAGVGLFFIYLISVWLDFKYRPYNHELVLQNPHLVNAVGFFVYFVIVLAIHFGLFSALFGVGVQKAIWLVFMLRSFQFMWSSRISWQQEHYGFLYSDGLYLKFWMALSRFPYLIALILLAYGVDVVGELQFLYFSPFLAFVLYIPYRFWVKNDIYAYHSDGGKPGDHQYQDALQKRWRLERDRKALFSCIGAINTLIEWSSEDYEYIPPDISEVDGKEFKAEVEALHNKASPEFKDNENYQTAYDILMNEGVVDRWINRGYNWEK